MALLVAAFSLSAIFSGEILTVNGGFGWDGTRYAAIAKDFGPEVFGRKLDAYRMQRIAPSGAVHYGLRLLGLSTADDAHILRGFQVYNMLLLIAGVYAWHGIAARLGLGPRGLWLGFAAMYVNFAVLKMTFFSPVLTDTTALVAGMFLLYGHLAGHAWLVWLVGLAGAFTWPLLLPLALVLLAFPRGAGPPDVPAGRLPARWWIAGGSAVAVAAAWRVVVVGQTIDGAGPIWYSWAPLAAVLVCAYLAAATWWLIDRQALARLRRVLAEPQQRGVPNEHSRFGDGTEQTAGNALRGVPERGLAASRAIHGTPRRAFPTGHRPRITQDHLAALALAAAVAALRTFVFVPSAEPGYTVKQYLCAVLVSSVAKPGVFFVAHVVYFGPIVVAAILLWPRVCERIRGQGPGVVILAGTAVVLSIGSESRQLVSFLPLVAAFTVPAIDELPRARWHDVVFLAAGLVASKCWLPLNHGPTTGNLLEFPDQLYFMNQGPWMSDGMYLAQGMIVLAMAAALAWMKREREPNTALCTGGAGATLRGRGSEASPRCPRGAFPS